MKGKLIQSDLTSWDDLDDAVKELLIPNVLFMIMQ